MKELTKSIKYFDVFRYALKRIIEGYEDFEIRISGTKTIRIYKTYMDWYKVSGVLFNGETKETIIEMGTDDNINNLKNIIGATYMVLERR